MQDKTKPTFDEARTLTRNVYSKAGQVAPFALVDHPDGQKTYSLKGCCMLHALEHLRRAIAEQGASCVVMTLSGLHAPKGSVEGQATIDKIVHNPATIPSAMIYVEDGACCELWGTPLMVGAAQVDTLGEFDLYLNDARKLFGGLLPQRAAN